MTIEEIREKILTDDEFVEDEFRKLQYFYGLQRVIRNNFKRTEDIETESVAEHIYAMGILANYFSKLENSNGDLDMSKVYNLILWHDIEEIETGDIIGYLKTPEDRAREDAATAIVISKMPILIQEEIKLLLVEYKQQSTPESQFVKAIDKIDPVFYLLNENGKKQFSVHSVTESDYNHHKKVHIEKYPYMFRFFQMATKKFREGGYFSDIK